MEYSKWLRMYLRAKTEQDAAVAIAAMPGAGLPEKAGRALWVNPERVMDILWAAWVPPWPRVRFCPHMNRDDIYLMDGTGEFFCGELGFIDMGWIRLWVEAGCR